jgi:tetratricopeptide (TPR) repeat protein
MNKTLVFAILMTLCFGANASELKITSNPEDCEVVVKNAQTGQESTLGKTPYTGNLETISQNVAGSNVFMVQLKKEGFEPMRIIVTKVGNTDIVLSANLEISKNITLNRDFDTLAGELFDVQRLIRVKDYDSSLKKLDQLEKKFPHFSVVYEMKGSVFYLTKEYKRALAYYRKAFATNPDNMDAYRMKIYLEKKFNITSTAPVSDKG